MPLVLSAEPVSLIGATAFGNPVQALLAHPLNASLPQPNSRAEARGGAAGIERGTTADTNRGPSLFNDRTGSSFFAPFPRRGPMQQTAPRVEAPHATLARLHRLIGQAESSQNGYDAIQHQAKVLPPKRPTDMTIGEIFVWINATPGQQHAIGRYQFIPDTLERLVNDLGISQAQMFSPDLQDKMANVLLQDAGLTEFLFGRLPRHAFMNNLAKIWAGLPTSNGTSHYHGFAGNKASMSWATFDAEMVNVFGS